jgi:Protein of unknown function (DUF4038)/Putative collagen-binding domain of a collagenase
MIIESLERRQLMAYTGPDMPLIRVSDNRRHLVQDNGTPFLVVGDAAWSLVVEPSRTEVDQYLTDRANRGFNLVMVNLIEALFNGPVNAENQYPFLDGDFNTPNETYFEFVDYTIAKAAEKGIYVLLCPAYLGFPGTTSGWYEQLIAAGEGKAFNYGRYVGNRYKDFDNIIWLMGGDREPDEAREENSAVAAGIKSVDNRHIMTSHSLVEFSAIQSYNEWWLDFNTTYTYGLTYLRTRGDYVDTPNMPSFLLETKYEGEFSGGNNYEWRASKWWALTEGAAGAIMGNRPLWLFDEGWQGQLNSQLTNDMARLGAFYDRLDWSKLEIDLDDSLIGVGQGTYTLPDFVTTSIARDRGFSVSYLPSARTISVELSEFAQPVVAKWFDPTSGNYTTATGTLQNSGRINLYPPGAFNSIGDGDWVLLMEPAGSTPPPIGNLTAPSGLFSTINSTARSVTLGWADNASDETGFEIQRRFRGVSGWETIGSVGANVTRYDDFSAGNGVTFEYRVVAVRGTTTAASDGIEVAVSYASTTPPPTGTGQNPVADPSDAGAPGTFGFRVDAGPVVVLTWVDRTSGEESYRVDRRAAGSTSWSTVQWIGANSTTYRDATVTNNQSYEYRVVAFQPGGIQRLSSTLSVNVGGTTPPPTGGSGTVTGVVFYDFNYSTIREPGEGGTPDKLIYVDLNNNRVADANEPQRATDIGGWYQLTDVPAGTWNVRYQISSGFYQSFPWDDRPRVITIAGGQTIGSQDFGTMFIPTTSANTLFIDRAGDGIMNGSDKPIRNIPIFADVNGNRLIDKGEPVAQTDSRGRFNVGIARPVMPVGMARRGFELQYTSPGVAMPFVDRNSNTRFDSKRDLRIIGAQFFHDDNNNGVLDTGERTFRTGKAGTFTFGTTPIRLELIRQIGL